MIDLTGRRALVTGGTRGIGLATAELLERAGAKVVAAGRTKHGDLGDVLNAQRVVNEAVRTMGGLDIVVVNHGIWPAEDVPLGKLSDERWDSTMRANLDSLFYVCRAAIPHIPPGGTIVLVASTAGQRGEAFHADYAATKGAVISLTKSLAVELAPRVTVNCVAPGWVDTDMSAATLKAKPEILKTIPLGRPGSAEDIAGPIVFLCSPLARNITGEILNVNGGSVLCG
jgi:3-oxoacyl-[acyl-carrier protein] reductase